MKQATFFIIAVLLAVVVTATTITFISNPISADVSVHSECNDGLDNDGDTFIDGLDADCSDLCHNEDSSITSCI